MTILLSPQHFELEGVEGGLEEMNGSEVGVDGEVAVGPLRILVSTDEEFEGEVFEDVNRDRCQRLDCAPKMRHAKR